MTALLQARVDAAGMVPRPLVGPGPLDDLGQIPRVGVHLYRTTRNAALSVDEYATRSAAGEVRRTPTAVLDLHYLLTFRGIEPYQSEQLLALCAAGLGAVTDLSPELIALATASHPEIAGNDLAQAAERVRVTPEALPLDEISRLWALYSPGAFTVTLAYAAGPVHVESVEVPGTVLPVAKAAFDARPIAAPRLDAVAGPDGVGAPVRAASPMPPLQLFGGQLTARSGETLAVLLDGTPVAPVTVVDDGRLTIPLTPVKPGRHTVQVRRLGAPTDPVLTSTRPAASSQTVTFTVVPTLSAATANTHGVNGGRSGTVSADVIPAVAAPQRVRLLLDSVAATPPVALAVDMPLASDRPPQTSVTANVVDVPAGVYRVTLEVDRVRSLPRLDAQGLYQLTEVTL
ncbi:Pvc16 family protein [Streptomyces sp. NPDC050481]